MELTREIGLYRNEVLQWRLDLAKDYMPRREFEEYRQGVKDQFKDLITRSDTSATRLWLALSAVAAAISAIAASAAWLRPFH